MRWSVKLLSPSLVVGTGRELRLGPDEEGRSAKLTVSIHGSFVEFAADAAGTGGQADRPPYPEWYNRAHLAVLLNPGHDHATRWLYAVDDKGEVTRKAEWALPGEEPGDRLAKPLDDPPEAEGRFEQLDRNRFRARLRVPAGGVWPEGQTVAGIKVKVGFHAECIPDPLRWPEEEDGAGDAPLGFGDLYSAPPPVRVDAIEIPEPAWGGQATWLTIHATTGPACPDSGQVRAEAILPGDSQHPQEPAGWRASGDRLDVRVPVVFPHRGKWANDLLAIARLRLTFVDDAGRPLWSGLYPFGFDAGIIVRERYDEGGALPPRPEPVDADFVDKFRRYILARLPDYRWRTTRQGASSDFCLEDPAGRAHLDLFEPDWPDSVAAMLAERFGRWDDALCAAAMWVYHPHVTRHSSSWSRISGQVAVEAIPRLGGCFCNDTARLTAMLAEKIAPHFDLDLRAYSLGLRGHCATLVATPVGRVGIDGMMGLWFHTLDNTRLATLEEMRACREIAERMWYCPRAHGHEFFFGQHDQIIRPWDRGALNWPTGT